MSLAELIEALNHLKVEPGSLACLGCGYEHHCPTHGCRIIREAAEWLEVVSISEAFGIGPERMPRDLFPALQRNTEELARMEKDVDIDYAYEKLRRRAEQVTGIDIKYLYEHEMREAQRRQGGKP